jgi:hypothetical protein
MQAIQICLKELLRELAPVGIFLHPQWDEALGNLWEITQEGVVLGAFPAIGVAV